MARSYRTDPRWRIASRNAQRDAATRVLLPRIVVREPRIGDVHPIPKQTLARMLSRLPVELYHGLRLIEMLPRQAEVGCPFGVYRTASKTIRLYSLPLTIRFPHVSPWLRRLLTLSEATIVLQADGHVVSWRDPFLMGFWFYTDVFIHELGHHHRLHYRSKNGRPKRRLEEEFMANLYCHWATVGRLSPKKYARKAKADAAPTGCSKTPTGNSRVAEGHHR